MADIGYEININYLFGIRNRRQEYIKGWCSELYNKYGNHIIIIGVNKCMAYTQYWEIYNASDYYNIIIREVIKCISMIPSHAAYSVMMDILNIDISRSVFVEFLKIFSYKCADVIKYIDSRHIYISHQDTNRIVELIKSENSEQSYFILRDRKISDYIISSIISQIGYQQVEEIIKNGAPIIHGDNINIQRFCAYSRKIHSKLTKYIEFPK